MKPSSAIADARVILNDPNTGTPRWADATLLGYFNDFLKALAKRQPALFSTTSAISLVAGELQSVSVETTNGLLDVLKNKAGQSVRLVARDALENASRTWRARSVRAAESWSRLTPGDPYRFLVYPPAAASDALHVLVAAIPEDVEIAAIDTNLASVPATYRAAAAGYISGRALTVNTNAADTEKGLALVREAMSQMGG